MPMTVSILCFKTLAADEESGAQKLYVVWMVLSLSYSKSPQVLLELKTPAHQL